MDKIIQLGLKVTPVSQNLLNFTLVYNDPSSIVPKDNSGLVSFQVPYTAKHWVHFAIQVMNDKITFYHNCIEISTVNISKEPKELVFDSASTFYLAQAGSIIKEKFGSIPSKTAPLEFKSYDVPDHKGLLVAVASDAEASNTTVRVDYKHPLSTTSNLGDMRKGMVAEMFNQILGTRLDELVQKGGTPFTFAYSNFFNMVRTKNMFESFGMVKETGILEGLKILLIENERVKKYGFTKGEFDRAKTEMMTGMERAFKEKDKTESNRYASAMVSSFLENEPLVSTEFRLEFYKKYLDGITLEEVNALSKKWISEKGENAGVIINAPKKEGLVLPTEDEIRKLFDEVVNAKIDAPKDEAVATQLMKTMPKAGKVVNETKNAELGLTEWTLSNGAKVVFKTTNFKNDEVMMSAFSPGGYAMYPVGDDLNGGFASFGIAQSGLGDLDPVQFQRYMTGKVARISPYISELFEGMNGMYSPKDAETAFQIMNLFFTAPRKDEKMFKNVLQQQRGMIENMGKSPEAAFRDSVTVAMYNNHPRRQPMKVEKLDKVNPDRSYEIYKDRFADAGDFTFFFVGNIDEKTFKPMVETYIASLPTMGRKETWKDPNVTPVAASLDKTIKRGIEPKSQVQLTYLGDAKYTRKDNFEMQALVKLLDIKLREKIREEKGGTYGVAVQQSLTKFPKERYQLTVSFGCAPEKVPELMDAAIKEVESVLAAGSDDKNLVKIKETFLRERETNLKENRFWMSYVSTSYQNGMDVMDMNKYNEWVNALKGSDFKKMAKKYIKKGKLVKFTLKPDVKA